MSEHNFTKDEIKSLIVSVRPMVLNASTDESKRYWGVIYNKLKVISLDMELDEDEDGL